MSSGADSGEDKKRSPIANGTLFVIALVLVFGLGWFLYRTTIPPSWLRNVGAEIALRAAPDPSAPLPEDSRQATPRGKADSPYICMANVIPIAWDRMVVVTNPAEARSHPLLAAADWTGQRKLVDVSGAPGAEQLSDELAKDERYQAIVLIKDNKVAAQELFFTFWADLKALANPDGWSPATAIFTAKVQGGTYVLSAPAPEDLPANVCQKKMD